MAKPPINIVLIGAGNVGHHLGHRFVEQGFSIQQVFSRKITKARKLAKKVGAEAIKDLTNIRPDADLYIIAVHDDAILSVAQKISPIIPTALVVHTSGAKACVILKPFFKNYGSFYPLQTFSISKKVNFEILPLCIYSPQKRNRTFLKKIAQSICPNVYEINDQQKSILHVAAVIVNNFPNYLYHIGHQITKEHKLSFDILKPLIAETVHKIQDKTPKSMQTGPARRGDKETISSHLKLLQSNKTWTAIYKLLSESIEKEF